MRNILVAKNITYAYFENAKINILEEMELQLQAHQITLLCGTSGCGKSTLAYILAGLYPENGGFLRTGAVYVDGVNIHALPANKRVKYVSMMFQNCDLQFCMNNLKNELLFCLENIDTPVDEKEKIIEDVVRCVGVEALLYRDFHKMSGGEKQKCALCCILALKPRCIILDEAFANVDTRSAKEMIAVLKGLGVTILAIDHNVGIWEGVYDRIIYMDECKTQHIYQDKNQERYSGEGAGKKVICVENLSIHNIKYPNMAFPKGSMTAILGDSGSGKTTFFKTLIGQNKYGGHIELLGKALSKWKRHDIFSKCGIVFQNPSNQFLSMTVYDEILFSVKRWNKGKDSLWHSERTNHLLSLFDLSKYKNYPPYILSQGQQRRLAVIAMIAGEQEILLLDEPTYGQDFENICSIMMLLSEKARSGLTIIFSTHNEEVAKHFAHQIIRIGE